MYGNSIHCSRFRNTASFIGGEVDLEFTGISKAQHLRRTRSQSLIQRVQWHQVKEHVALTQLFLAFLAVIPTRLSWPSLHTVNTRKKCGDYFLRKLALLLRRAGTCFSLMGKKLGHASHRYPGQQNIFKWPLRLFVVSLKLSVQHLRDKIQAVLFVIVVPWSWSITRRIITQTGLVKLTGEIKGANSEALEWESLPARIPWCCSLFGSNANISSANAGVRS